MIIADLGSAVFLSGDRPGANELWEQIIGDEAALEDGKLIWIRWSGMACPNKRDSD